MKQALIDPIRQRLPDRSFGNGIARLSGTTDLTRWYLTALMLAALAFLAFTPVSSGDTDLWYHMNGGRLLWEFGDLPDTAFFSFTETQSDWVNYFWGFQALSYQVFSLAGYEGLLALRVILVGLTIAAITSIVVHNTDTPTQRAWALALLALVLIVLMGRVALIRPHLTSYLMISVFLLILEHRSKWLPALPFLTVLWINMHGVEWVVGAAICGAYFIERLWRWHRSGKPMDAVTRTALWWIVLCLPALLVNPFGIKVLTAPFSTPSDVYHYITELRSMTFASLTSPGFAGGVISVNGAIGFLFAGNLLAYGLLLVKRKFRLAPLILSLVGLVLLARGRRFVWEWLLLSLPLWRSAIDVLDATVHARRSRTLGVGGLGLMLLLPAPFVTWYNDAKSYQQWPLDDENLPIGITDFIRGQQIEGRLLAPPNTGGYLAWRLYPEVLISGDMQSPPTSTWSHHRVRTALNDPYPLQRFVDTYRPELIAVEYNKKGFSNLIASQPVYRPVFFDDVYVLYAHAGLLPDLVAGYEFKHVNPHDLLDYENRAGEQHLEELERVLRHDRDGDRVQHGITRLLIELERFDEALQFAKGFRDTHPENANSHFLIGNALEHLDRCEEAIPHFNAAFAVAPDDFHAVLHRHLGSCAYLSKDFGAAYRHFEKGINTYIDAVEPEHRFQYALSAVAVGEEDKARTLLRHLLYAVDPADTESIEKAQALLSDL